jgi:hypothetical protein
LLHAELGWNEGEADAEAEAMLRYSGWNNESERVLYMCEKMSKGKGGSEE